MMNKLNPNLLFAHLWKVIRDFKQIAMEGSTTVAGSKISWKKPLRMCDMRFPAIPLLLSMQEEAIGHSVYYNRVSCLNFTF